MDDSVLSRRRFIGTAAGTLVVAATPILTLASQTQPKPRPPAISPDIVKEFVIAAHSKFDKTKEMLGNDPHLINATWDWGAGDFEMGIGGAGHVGSRDIALYMIEQGARYDIFIAAMLGELTVVKAMLAIHPNMLHSKGPHGIPLDAHARVGGDQAAETLAYIQSLTQG
jgi:hypothetical protein